jgi:hypothetical protein
MARIRAQLVFEALEEDRFFMACRFSEGDDPNGLGCLGVNDGDRSAPKEPEPDEALLVVLEAVVFEREGDAFEHSRRVNEVEPVGFQVLSSLTLVPQNAHLRSVYTRVRLRQSVTVPLDVADERPRSGASARSNSRAQRAPQVLYLSRSAPTLC